MDSEKTIYELDLHEGKMIKIKMNDIHLLPMMVIRVPQGFLYLDQKFNQTTFVPYNENLDVK